MGRVVRLGFFSGGGGSPPELGPRQIAGRRSGYNPLEAADFRQIQMKMTESNHYFCQLGVKFCYRLLRRLDGGPTNYYRRRFYPRDPMLAWVLAVALRLSVCVCLSQVGFLSKRYKNEPSCSWYESFLPPILRLKGNLGISGLRENFASAYRPSKCVIDLARERWTLRA